VLPSKSGDRTLSAHDGRTSAHDPTTAGLLAFAALQRAAHTLHIDVKNLGRSPTEGLARPAPYRRRGPKRKQRNGSDYLHSLVNDHSRRVFGTFCRQEAITCADFLTRAAACFCDRALLTSSG
jgi:hypothetical protein